MLLMNPPAGYGGRLGQPFVKRGLQLPAQVEGVGLQLLGGLGVGPDGTVNVGLQHGREVNRSASNGAVAG
eukprot:13495051-Alexandrium_andersonii.AAC.1